MLFRRLVVINLEVLVEEFGGLGHLVKRFRPLPVGLGHGLRVGPAGHADAQALELPLQFETQALRRGSHDVLLIEPGELVRVEAR